jgi:hypothetical protein
LRRTGLIAVSPDGFVGSCLVAIIASVHQLRP